MSLMGVCMMKDVRLPKGILELFYCQLTSRSSSLLLCEVSVWCKWWDWPQYFQRQTSTVRTTVSGAEADSAP